MAAIKHISTKHFLLLMLILFICKSSSEVNMTEDVMPVPVRLGRNEYAMLAGGGRLRRRLSPFQICSTCKCCLVASDPTTCSNMPCCYKIDCNIPGKPFGYCAFVPTSCNCNNCASS